MIRSTNIALHILLSVCLIGGCATGPVVDESPRLIYQSVNPGANPVFKRAVKEADGARHSRIQLTADATKESLSDFRLDLDFKIRDQQLTDTEMIWTQTTMMLLTLYPSSCGRYELELAAELYDRDGNRVKTWHFVETDTAFLWLAQGRDCAGEQSDSTIEKISTRMLKKLYAQLARDDILSGQAPGPVDNAPLVYVDARNARQVVQRVIKTEEPFQNFTFDSEEGKSAHRTLDIRFEFIAPEQSIGNVLGRGAGAIMTLGLMSMCRPSEMILKADVIDDDGTVLRTYRYKKKKRGSSDIACSPATDYTHPEMVAKLLRKLLRQIEKDGLIQQGKG